MKKLLSILASASLIISAPVNLVACGGTKRPDIKDEYDYEKIFNELMEVANNIFASSLQTEFDYLYFLTLDKAEEIWGKAFDFEKLCGYVATQDRYVLKSDKDSEFLKQIDNFIQEKKTINKIKQEAETQIIGNVNFKVLLNQNKNPFSSPLILEKVEIVSKSRTQDDRVVAIEYTLATNLELVDATGSVYYERITYTASSTIFETDEVADALNEITHKYQNILADDKYSSRFTFENNDGEENNYTKNKSNFLGFETIFEKEVSPELLKGINNPERYKISTKDAKYSASDVVSFETETVWTSRTFSWDKESDYRVKNIKAALKEGGQKLDDLVEQMAGENFDSSYHSQYIDRTPKSFLKQYPDSSAYINSWNIFDTLNNGQSKQNLRDTLKTKGINFKTNLDTIEQRRVIKILPTYVNNIKINYHFAQTNEDLEFNLPRTFFMNKQLTTKSGTLEMHKEYVKANLLFQRELYGYARKDTISSTRDLDYTLQIKRPKSYTQEIEPGKLYPFIEFIELAIQEAIEKATARYPEIKFSDYINGYAFSPGINYFKINRAGYLFLYDRDKKFSNQLDFLFSWGNGRNAFDSLDRFSLYFNSGFQVDTINTEYSSEKTPWKMVGY
ncbi:lipoprotein [Spiroplasma endosymbiont of Panorpa germanica]|uniref:lipoprotein n=1 Tax=Spiroplasma endosymbiont of Panorpa germanica TaxID=3066314 RepID=UPI0030CF9BBF